MYNYKQRDWLFEAPAPHKLPYQTSLEYGTYETTQRAAPRFFKDMPQLRTAPLPPARAIAINRGWPRNRQTLARTYNRLGGLMANLARTVRVNLPAVLAVWYVESGGLVHTPGQAIIRFENHLFFQQWGRRNPTIYDQYFRHGGRNNHPGRRWDSHYFRENLNAPFERVNVNQATEYRALALARRLAGDNAAILSISIGGPQILVNNYRSIGYASPLEMYQAFQNDERFHVLGFFDFCRQKGLLEYLRTQNWYAFACSYNGPGQVAVYGARLQEIYQQARLLPGLQ